MNICLLTPTFLPKLGGVEIIVSSLASRYVQAGHRVVVVTQWPRKGKGEPQDDLLPYPVIRYRRPISFFWSFGMHGIEKALEQANKAVPFDLIHCHLAYPCGPIATNFAQQHHLPVVMTTHGSDIRTDSRYRQRKSIWEKICRSIRQADAVTAISQDMQALLRQIIGQGDKDIPVIPNAVDVDSLATPVGYDPAWPIERNDPYMLYLGGLTRKKGVDVLLEAACKLRDNNELSTKLVVAGDGTEREKYQQYVRDNRLENYVQFVGKVSGAFKNYLLQNCRFLIMPSITEGFGLVALEAFSCGKPVVASAVGGLKELMGEHETLGLLTPPGDADALAKTIGEMDGRYESFPPDAIRHYARQFDWPNVAGIYLMLYRSLLEPVSCVT